jgi:hypothetical protein
LGFIFASDDGSATIGTGHVKIDSVDTSLLYNKIDVLSPIEGTYQNNNLFYIVAQTTTIVSFFACVAIAFLLHLGFIFNQPNKTTKHHLTYRHPHPQFPT